MTDDEILEDILDNVKAMNDVLDDALEKSKFSTTCWGLFINSPYYSKEIEDRILGRLSELWEKYNVWYDEEAEKYELD
jgi:hypothetical protein